MNKNDPNLFVVATPIGNLKDISERAIETIKSCDFVVCENPKHSLKLLNKLDIKKKLISLHDYNENDIINKISSSLISKKVVLISDAGSPLISDPGFKLIQHCIKNNISITSVPGPSAIIPALQLSGIPINEFCFFGYFPKINKQINTFMKNIKEFDKTAVFFVSSHKLEICLGILEKEFSDRSVSLSKELTKINEKIFWGKGNEIKKKVKEKITNLKGEFVIVIAPKLVKKTESTDLGDYKREINRLLSKFSLTDVVEIVHKLTGITKNKVYKWVLNLKKS